MNTKVALELGKKTFSIEVAELSLEEKNILTKKFKVEQEKVSAYNTIKVEFTDLVETYDTNKALLEHDENISIVEKVKMLWEQKKLLTKIKEMRAQVQQKAEEPIYFEEIAKEQFEIIISGDHKIELMRAIDEAKKPYQEIMSTILDAVKKEKEKKSSNS